jgi:hypothetical protein
VRREGKRTAPLGAFSLIPSRGANSPAMAFRTRASPGRDGDRIRAAAPSCPIFRLVRSKMRVLLRVVAGSSPAAAIARPRLPPPPAIRWGELALPGGAALAAPQRGDCAYLTMRFWEHAVSPRPTPAGGPATMSMTEQPCVVAVSPNTAAQAVALARLLRSGAGCQVDPGFVTRRIRQPAPQTPVTGPLPAIRALSSISRCRPASAGSPRVPWAAASARSG